MTGFLERLQSEILLCDGAMGTALYSKGVFINRCFEELNLSDPVLVRDVHREYVNAGVDIIETNTFGGNRVRLRQQGVEDKFEAINRAGADLAREEAGDAVFVAGSIGPTGLSVVRLRDGHSTLGFWSSESEEAEAAFREQASVLAGAGVDLLVLESFHSLAEIELAIRAAKSVADLPVVALLNIGKDGQLADGAGSREAMTSLSAGPADVIGFNCGIGPRQIYEIIRDLGGAATKPLAAQPNAGYPVELGGRTLYLTTPEYMATYAQHMIRTGVRLVGGCCGTTVAHIRAMHGTVRGLSPGRAVIHVGPSREQDEAKPEVALAERSALGGKFARGERVCSVEIAPPQGAASERFLDSCRALRDAGVQLVNIPDGPRAIARMANMMAALLVKEKVGIETIQHFCARDRNLLAVQSHLLGAHAVGLDNVLFITGDPPKMGDYPEATAVFDLDSIGMIQIAQNLNRGLDMRGRPIQAQTHFFIATGVEPAAADIDKEVSRLRKKVEAGAQVVFSQPVYELESVDRLLNMIEDLPVPIMLGILPLASHRNAEFLHNEVPGMAIPEAIRERMRKAGAGAAAQDEGVAIARDTVDAFKDRVYGFYVMPPFNRHDAAIRVLEGLI